MSPRRQTDGCVSSVKTPDRGLRIATEPAASADEEKEKQLKPASAAGRKIARKTAHSLIERRRRSKINEEFSVLKNMIPACTGEMHKLSILQVLPTFLLVPQPRLVMRQVWLFNRD